MSNKEQSESIQAKLEAAGFGSAEAAVYIALLELGKGNVTQIATRAKINRTSGYHILAGLAARGLATITGHKPKQEYAAEHPAKLERLVALELERQKGKMARTSAVVSELDQIYNRTGRPRVRFFEGTSGLREVYENTLTSHEGIRAIASIEDMHDALPGYFPAYYARRAKKGISIRAIIPDSETAEKRTRSDAEELRETALVPKASYSFSPEINVYDDKVMIASWREKLGIVIESSEISDAMKKLFDLAWAEAKRIDVRQWE